VVTTLYSAIKIGFFDKIDNVSGSNIIKKRSFTEESVKCLLRVLVHAGHSIGMCLTVRPSGQWQAEHSGWSVPDNK